MTEEETKPFSTDFPKDQTEIPPNSEYTTLLGCFWRTYGTYKTKINFTFYTIWPFDLVMLFSFFTLYAFIVMFLPTLPPRLQFLKGHAIFWNLSMFFYFQITRFTNPGVIPWNWSVSKKKQFTKHELRLGAIATTEQYEFAKSHETPPRSWISSSYGYTVLRGDHYCGWIGNFIGLRNHKYFVNGIISATIYISLAFYASLYSYFKGTSMLTPVIGLIAYPFGFFLLLLAAGQVWTQLTQLTYNTTTVERLSKCQLLYYDDNKLEGFEQVYGPIKYWWQWPLPIPAKNGDGFQYEYRDKEAYIRQFEEGEIQEAGGAASSKNDNFDGFVDITKEATMKEPTV